MWASLFIACHGFENAFVIPDLSVLKSLSRVSVCRCLFVFPCTV